MFKLVPPPEKLLTGAELSFLNSDTLLLSHHKRRKQEGEPLILFELEEKEFEQLLKVRRDEGLGTQTFWGIVQNVVMNKSSYSQFNNRVGIYDLEVWLEFPVSELTSPVPAGMHNSDDGQGGQMSWEDWNAGGNQPIAISVDNTKCIVRTNINNVVPDMNELLVLGQYVQGNPDRTILNSSEVGGLMGSIDY